MLQLPTNHVHYYMRVNSEEHLTNQYHMTQESRIKRPCECTITHDISLENVSRMHELSEAFRAISLRHTCLLSILEQFSKLSSRPGTLFFAMSNVGEIYIHWICRNYIGYCTRSPHSY
uniref:Uncharacterized protein n=1 Tax=Vitis vinifera TaxID=29760 RepID=F6I1Z6_VITVI